MKNRTVFLALLFGLMLAWIVEFNDQPRSTTAAPLGCQENSTYKLPWEAGRVMTVNQGNGGGTSHNTSLSWYAFDFGNGSAQGVILAAQGGTVSSVQQGYTKSDGSGTPANYIVIDHGQDADAYLHIYPESASQFGIRPGVPVQRGQPIARVGCVGYCTGPHIHFQRQGLGTPVGDGLTNSKPVSFSDSDVCNKNPDGVPTYPNGYTSSNTRAAEPILSFRLDFTRGIRGVPATVEVRPIGFAFELYGSTLSQTVTPDSNGVYSVVLNGGSPGIYDVLVKPRTWLRMLKPQVLLSSGFNNLDWSGEIRSSCIGDIDGDNTIDGTDLGIVIADFDPGVLKPNSRSDLDGDNMVDASDLGLLISCFAPGKTGAGGPMQGVIPPRTWNTGTNLPSKKPSANPGQITLQSTLSRTGARPRSNTYQVGDIISITASFDTGGKAVDGIKGIINYDPGVFQLISHAKESNGFGFSDVYSGTASFLFQASNSPGSTPVSGTGGLVTIALRAINSTPASSITLKLDPGIEWNSKIVEHDTAQDVLGSVVNATVAVNGSPARPARTGTFVSPITGEFINSSIAQALFTADDPVRGIQKIGLEAFYDGTWHSVGKTDGSKQSGFNPGTGADSAVTSIAPLSDGKTLIGGYFQTVNGTIQNGIAKLNADGSVDTTFNVGDGNYSIADSCLAVQQDGKILIGGLFADIHNTLSDRVTRLYPDGTLDTSFVLGSGANDRILALALQSDGKVLIGGRFTQVNGQTRNHVARLNADGTLDTTFNAGTAVNDYGVLDIAVQADGKVLIGGEFMSVNGISRNRIARLNSDGTLDTSFNPGTGANSEVDTVAVQSDGKIVIGGYFQSVNGVVLYRVARLNTDGSVDSTFRISDGGALNGAVLDIAVLPDGKILLGGWFTSYNVSPLKYIARLNRDGTLDYAFNPGTGADSFVSVITPLPDGKILIGGNFTQVNGQTFNRIARLDEDGTTDWRIYWNTQSIGDQIINLRAFIGDNAGNGLQVFSNNITLDRTPPAYVSTNISPSRAKPGQSITINLQTRDNLAGVNHSQVYVNSASNGSINGQWNLVGTINGCCGSVVWNTTGYTQGTYRIAFDIQDNAGNTNDWIYGSQPIVTIPLGDNFMFFPFIRK